MVFVFCYNDGMKFNIRSLDPHDWRKLVIEEDDREALVRQFEPSSLADAVAAVDQVTEVVIDHNLEDQVQFSVEANRLLIFIHHFDKGPIDESHLALSSAIDAKLELS